MGVNTGMKHLKILYDIDDRTNLSEMMKVALCSFIYPYLANDECFIYHKTIHQF